MLTLTRHTADNTIRAHLLAQWAARHNATTETRGGIVSHTAEPTPQAREEQRAIMVLLAALPGAEKRLAQLRAAGYQVDPETAQEWIDVRREECGD